MGFYLYENSTFLSFFSFLSLINKVVILYVLHLQLTTN